VLSGVLSALSCYILDPVAAAWSAAYVAGKAGEAAEEKFGAVSMIASDTIAELPGVFKKICK
ncbi:MAG: bifunctional ADP-dependent NAD(P)H-hydrate dehydratase/NAD(P)H-hydrate epimerase, partial [Clostridia bacterium]|nr:bifunctional ADP-dependent NAD(P)H-hydrate dehydratase/NAD(P)H-hydrate epimerase [Clostridia bacterium]